MVSRATKVYIEKDGRHYNDEIDFSINGYAYRNSVLDPFKKEEKCVPEKIYSFKVHYRGYGEIIHLLSSDQDGSESEYFVLEGTTKNNRDFVIKNFTGIPPECESIDQYDIYYEGNYYKTKKGYEECSGSSHTFESSCMNYLTKVNSSNFIGDQYGHPIDSLCILHIDLDKAKWGNKQIQKEEKENFFKGIGSFFKRMFKGIY